MRVTIVGTVGPLFTIAEDDSTVTFLRQRYPQCFKKFYGWQLSVEELHFIKEEPLPGVAVEVVFATDAAEKQFEEMKQANCTACSIYRQLTRDHSYQLRHGSQFGALFIGYKDIRSHGEYLFFMGPLHDLERIRALRISHSVGKRAIVVSMDSSFALSLTTLTAEVEMARSVHRKKHRSEVLR